MTNTDDVTTLTVVSSPQGGASAARGRSEAAGKRPTAATAPLTTPLRTLLPIAEPRWAASQLAPGANQEPVEKAAVTCQNGACQSP